MTEHKVAALFDLDGVLVDSEPGYTVIWDHIVSVYPTGIENFALKIKGNTLANILATYFPDEEQQRNVVRMIKEGEDKLPLPLFDGVVEFLTSLREAGIPAAIVTSSGDEKMNRLFAEHPGFRDFFDVVVTDSWVTKGKPDPECYLKAAEALGVPPENCYVFEDSYNGLKSGRAAGAHVVALATSNPREKLIELSDRVIDSFREFSVDDMV